MVVSRKSSSNSLIDGGVATPDTQPLVAMNVRGVHMLVDRLVLEESPYLACVIDPAFATRRDPQGRIFIDMDPVRFGWAYDLLRTSRVPAGLSNAEVSQLQAEAERLDFQPALHRTLALFPLQEAVRQAADGERANAHYTLAAALWELGNWEDARHHVTLGLTTEPRHAPVAFGRYWRAAHASRGNPLHFWTLAKVFTQRSAHDAARNCRATAYQLCEEPTWTAARAGLSAAVDSPAALQADATQAPERRDVTEAPGRRCVTKAPERREEPAILCRARSLAAAGNWELALNIVTDAMRTLLGPTEAMAALANWETNFDGFTAWPAEVERALTPWRQVMLTWADDQPSACGLIYNALRGVAGALDHADAAYDADFQRGVAAMRLADVRSLQDAAAADLEFLQKLHVAATEHADVPVRAVVQGCTPKNGGPWRLDAAASAQLGALLGADRSSYVHRAVVATLRQATTTVRPGTIASMMSLLPRLLPRLAPGPSVHVQVEINAMLRQLVDYEGALRAVVPFLTPAPEATRMGAAAVLRSAAESQQARRVIFSARALKPLVALLTGDHLVKTREHAVSVLARLAEDETSHRKAIVDAGALPALMALLREGSPEAQAAAVVVLGELGSGNEAPSAVFIAGVIAPLVKIMLTPQSKTRDIAAHLVAHLASTHLERQRDVVKAGAVASLVTLMADGTVREKAAASGAIAALVRSDDGAIVTGVVEAGALKPLVSLLSHGTVDAQGNAAQAIADLARKQLHVTRVARAGAIAPLLALLNTAPTQTAQKAARAIRGLVSDLSEGREGLLKAHPWEVLTTAMTQGEPAVQQHAVCTIVNLLCGDMPKDIATISAYLASALVAVVATATTPTPEKAIKALANLAFCPSATAAIVAARPLDALLPTLQDDQIREEGERLLKNLFGVPNAYDAAWAKSIQRTNLAPMIIKAALSGSPGMKAEALRALHGLAGSDEGCRVIDAVDAVPVLLAATTTGSPAVQASAGRGLNALVYRDQGRAALVRAGAIPALVEVAAGRSPGDPATALSTLTSLAKEGNDIVPALLEAGVMPVLVAAIDAGVRLDNGDLSQAVAALAALVSTPEGQVIARAESAEQVLRRVRKTATDPRAYKLAKGALKSLQETEKPRRWRFGA